MTVCGISSLTLGVLLPKAQRFKGDKCRARTCTSLSTEYRAVTDQPTSQVIQVALLSQRSRAMLCVYKQLASIVQFVERNFLLLCFFVFFCSVNNFSTTREPIHAKVCMRAQPGSGHEVSPFGVGGPRRAEKGANEIFVTTGVNGEFLHFGGFSAISQQRLHGSTPNIICVGRRSADVLLPLWCPSAPGGRKEGELNTQKIGGGLIRAQDSYDFYFSQRYQMQSNMQGSDLRTFWCRTVKIGQGVSTGWSKKFLKNRIFHHFQTLRPYISETIKNRGI